MQISLTFKHVNASDSLKAKVQEKFDKFDKMLDRPAEAHVVLSVENIRNIVEANLNGDKFQIHAKEESENMYSAIDAVADKVKLQIKKNKEKLKRHLAGDKESIKNNVTELVSPEVVAHNTNGG